MILSSYVFNFEGWHRVSLTKVSDGLDICFLSEEHMFAQTVQQRFRRSQ